MRSSRLLPFLCTAFAFSANAQETLLNDIRAFNGLYWIKEDLIRCIRKEKDTINYYHDEEIIIYYNQKKGKNLSANTFYVINHGFNKLFTLNVLLVELETTAKKNKKKLTITSPASVMNVYCQDSIPRSSHSTFRLGFHWKEKDDMEMKAIRVEIRYYDKVIYRWFIKEGSYPAEQKEI